MIFVQTIFLTLEASPFFSLQLDDVLGIGATSIMSFLKKDCVCFKGKVPA